ncbi:MAG: MFS transporter [Chloroflexi bacterium]|nr:MFS transporter [Chloroflexota bacterium]
MRSPFRPIASAIRDIDRPILTLAAISFISQVGVSIMLPLLPIFAIQLGASPRELGLMVSIFAVTQTLGQLGSGFISSRISPRRQLPLGQASYAAANFLIATARSAVPLIAFRSLAGFGGGLSIIAERLYVARVADRARLAFTNGVLSAAGSAGSVLGPALGGFLALADLRAPFVVVGLTASVAAIAAIVFLPAEPERPIAPAAEAMVAAAAMPAVAYLAGSGPPSSTRSRLRARAASIQPLGRLALWNLGFNAAYGGWITTFGPFAKDELGLPVNQVTLIFAMFGLGSIFIGPWLSRLADRRSRRQMVAFGSGLVFLNLVSMIAHAPVLVIFGSAIAAGGGLAAAQSSWFALLTVATDGGRRGRSFGLVTALSNLGVVAGATLASEIWQAAGIDRALLVAAGFMILATASLLLVREGSEGNLGTGAAPRNAGAAAPG